MTESVVLTSTQEDYLETIYHLVCQHNAARNKDIAEILQVKRATVTGAVKQLVDKGLVKHKVHGVITLTEDGRKIAEKIIKSHRLFEEFFHTILGLSEEEAGAIACQLEHIITGTALDRFESLISSIKGCNCQAKFDPFGEQYGE